MRQRAKQNELASFFMDTNDHKRQYINKGEIKP